MIGNPLRFGSPRLPLGRDHASLFLPWVFALIVCLAGLAGLGLLMVDDVRRASEDSIAARLTVQVPADASEARLQTVVAALRQTPGVRAVTLLTAAETARLLEPWLGAPVPVDELPVPRLIDVGIDRGEAIDIAKLRQQLAAIVPEVRIDDHQPLREGQRASALLLRGVLAAAVGAALLAAMLLGAYATRGALAARRSAIELLHLLGASDGAIVRPFAIRALLPAVLGGAIGVIAALAAVIVLRTADDFIRLPAAVASIGPGDWRLWAVLIAAIIAVAFVTTLAALAVVLRQLRRLT